MTRKFSQGGKILISRSIKGEPVDSVLTNIEKQQTQERVNEVKKDSAKLKNLWEKANATAPYGPAEPVNYVPFEEKGKCRCVVKAEVCRGGYRGIESSN